MQNFYTVNIEIRSQRCTFEGHVSLGLHSQ